MKIKSFILLCFVLIPFLNVSAVKAANEVKRTITNSFPASVNTVLKVDNKYGNINIIEWNNAEIAFTIEIIGKASKLSDAETLADRVSIDFKNTSTTVSATTVFQQLRNFNCNNCGTTVNYTINVPSYIMMNLTNKYGNIQFEDTKGNFKAEVKYGNLSASRIMGENNTIDIKYGNLNIDEIGEISIDIKYGNITMGTAEYMKLTSGYGNVKADRIDVLKLSCKYDNYTIKELGELSSSSAGYTKFKIGRLNNKFEIGDIKYGTVDIKEVSPNFQLIRIRASYTNVNLGISEKHNFDVKLINSYGKINTGDIRFNNVTMKEPDRYTKSIEGTVGNGNSGALIDISNRYSDIYFKNK